jgi:hypothetical protein
MWARNGGHVPDLRTSLPILPLSGTISGDVEDFRTSLLFVPAENLSTRPPHCQRRSSASPPPSAVMPSRRLDINPAMADPEDIEANKYELEDLAVVPGTYFNPQTEVVIIVDDSVSIGQDVFNLEHFEGSDWVRISDEVPVDEGALEVAVESFQTHYHPGGGGSVSASTLDLDEGEVDADEDGDGPEPDPELED